MPAVGLTSPVMRPQEELSPEEEKKTVDELTAAVEGTLKEGDSFFIVSARWWREWCHYVGEEDFQPLKEDGVALMESSMNGLPSSASVRRPPPIDNGELLDGPSTADSTAEPVLKGNLVEDRDYVLVPASVWKAFQNWYGGGPGIQRQVIKHGQQEESAVEVYPLVLRLRPWDRSEETAIRISKKALVSQLQKKVCGVYNLQSENVRLWDNFGGKRHKVLSDPNQCLEDAEIQMNNELLVEVKSGSSWPTESADIARDSLLSNTPTSSPDMSLAIIPASPEPEPAGQSIAGGALPSKGAQTSRSWAPFPPWTPFCTKDSDGGGGSGSSASSKEEPVGLTGLSNLGNTCFMNSSLQCLIHTPPIKDFFIGDYSSQINSRNPLGMQGELALAFGELLRKLWAPGKAPVAPRAFKTKLAKFAPQFSGYNQHDSQELLAFLLDGLHEDLNRVQRKPYIEAKDADGRPDDLVADEYWANHKARNDSVIVDTCQGQYKSTLVCPVCSKVSVTFDPFMYLSLPLPAKSHRSMTLTLISADGSRLPETHTLNVPKMGKFRDLHQLLGKACGLDASEKLLFGEVYNNRIFRFFLQETESLTNVSDGDKLVAYRIPANCNQRMVVVQRRPDKQSSLHVDPWKPFAAPLLVCAPTGLATGADLYKLVEASLRPFRVSAEGANGSGGVGEPGGSREEENGGSASPAAAEQNGAHPSSAGADGDSAMEDGEVEWVGDSSGGATSGGLDTGLGTTEQASLRGASGNARSQREETDMEVEGEVADSGEGGGASGQPDSERNGAGRAGSRGSGEAEGGGDAANGVMPDAGAENKPAPGSAHPFPFKLSSPRGQLDSVDSAIELDTPLPGLQNERHVSLDPRQVMLDWTEAGLEGCDMSVLEKLPETLRTALQQPGKSKRQEAVSLYSCLGSFLKEEPLGPDDMWYCPKCKEHRQASKKLDLWRLPEILVVHLKRFSYSRYLKNKLDTLVQFPVHDLNLTPYARSDPEGEPHLYELYAVSNHYGGLGGGHYTASCKVDTTNQWYNFDDSHVSLTNVDDILTSAAYVLFYQRKREPAKLEESLRPSSQREGSCME